MGFSNGAGVAMQLAIRHPELVHKVVYASYMTRKDGAYPMKARLWNDFPNISVGTDQHEIDLLCACSTSRDIEHESLGRRSAMPPDVPPLSS